MENINTTPKSIFGATEHELLTLSLAEIINGLKKEIKSHKKGTGESIAHSSILYAEGLRLAYTHLELAKKFIMASLFDTNTRSVEWLIANDELKLIEQLLGDMEFTFKKEDGKWFIVLPEWKDNPDDLQMVNGADTLLDILSHQQLEVTLKVWLSKPDTSCVSISKIAQDGQGATYQVSDCADYDGTVWLCNVAKFIFLGFHPQQIYFQVK